MSRTCSPVAILLLTATLVPAAHAQVHDGFDDGDFTSNPRWTGTVDRWVVAGLDGDPALRSNGLSASDTLFLATPSSVSYGTWSFTFTFGDVNLSNFNGARIFLMASTERLDGPLTGYYIQLGAVNTDDVRLYRLDGDPAASGNRVLLGQSDAAPLDGTSGTIAIRVTRSQDARWTVDADGAPVFSAEDDTYDQSAFFGVWVKHTATAGQAYAFDDFVVEGDAGPDDTEPPDVVSVTVVSADTLALVFSEAVDAATACAADHYDASPAVGRPARVVCDGAPVRSVRLLFDPPIPAGDYTVTVRDVDDLAGNRLDRADLPFSIVPAGAVPGTRDVVINEIYYDPPNTDLEFVELFNRSQKRFDLRDLSFSDDRLDPVPIADSPAFIEPGAYVVLARDARALESVFPGVEAVQVDGWPALNNGGDTPAVFFGTQVIDSVRYASSWGGHGVALERIDPAGPSDSRFNFGDAVDPLGATPGRVNSIYAPDVTPPQIVFVDEIDERVLEVVFDEPVAETALVPSTFAAGSAAPSSVSIRDDRTVQLIFDRPPDTAVLDAFDLADLTGNTIARTSHAVARLVRPGDVAITEVLFAPLADRFDHRPDQPEYVELLNRTDRLVSLRDVYWTKEEDERGDADTLRFAGTRVAVDPHGYAVVFSQPGGTDDPARDSQLARAFPALDLSGDGIDLLPVDRSSLSLRNTADVLRLHRADDATIEAVAYDAAWRDPNGPAAGVSLERIDPAVRPDDPLNWASSTADGGGTPGYPNTVSTQRVAAPMPGALVINEILFAPRTGSTNGLADQPELFELYNRSAEAIDLNGVYWTDEPDETGTADSTRIAFAPTALPASAYAVVVAHGDEPGATGRIEAAFPDAALDSALVLPLPGGSLGLANEGDRIQLHAPDGTVIEDVRYSPSWHHPSLSQTTGVSLERITTEGDANDATNWTSSTDPYGATPGRVNSVALAAPIVQRHAGLRIEPSPFSPDRDGFDDVTAIGYTLSGGASSIRVRIYDAQGRRVRTLVEAALAGPSGEVLWDGLDDQGRALRIGIYVVLLDAVDVAGGTTESYKGVVVLARPLD